MRWIVAALIVGCAAGCGASEPSDSQAEHGTHAGSPAEHAQAEPRADGLVVHVESPGSGRAAARGDTLALHYEAFVAGSEKAFDSTRESGLPLRVQLGAERPKLIEGLTLGLVGLRAGARARLEIPAALAWGAKGNESIGVPADAELVYELQVLSVSTEEAR